MCSSYNNIIATTITLSNFVTTSSIAGLQGNSIKYHTLDVKDGPHKKGLIEAWHITCTFNLEDYNYCTSSKIWHENNNIA